MADWQFTLNVEDIWEKSSKETEDTDYVPSWFIDELLKRLKVIHESLKKSSRMNMRSMGDLLEFIILDIETMKEPEGIQKDDFNHMIWEPLYNWADTSLDNQFGGKKMCWIKTRI